MRGILERLVPACAFSGNIADGYIWGRGTLDDKLPLMAILELSTCS